MASLTQIHKAKRSNKRKRAGHRRKRRLGAKSTLSYDELFAGMGPPAEPKSNASK
jgi:hypothetical protein